MDRNIFTQNFSKRLNESLLKGGYSSIRSKSGIGMAELAKVAGVSFQMATKYVSGLALPNCHIVLKIATWLNVSPTWLLFGEIEKPASAQTLSKSNTSIEIEFELLKYILNKFSFLLQPISSQDKIANYMAGVIYDASHINANHETIKNIIDMMVSSATNLIDMNEQKSA